MSDVVLSVPVDAGGVDPVLASLEKINQNLAEINASSKGSFDAFSKSLDKSNKKLKETDKTFGDIFKKIKLSGLMKLGAGVIGAGAGLLGISTGAMLFGALKNSAGVVSTGYQGAGLNMSSAEMKALQVASKLQTGKEETLMTAMTSLSNALNSGVAGGALSDLGLNQEQLKLLSPEKALEAVFEAVKGKGTGIGYEYLRKDFMEVTGLTGQDYNVATKKGASFGGDYREWLAKNAGVDFNALGRGAESLIKFQSQLDIISEKLGSKLADPLSAVLDKLTPWLDKFGDWLATLLGSITQEQVDAFMANVTKVFDFVANTAKFIVNSDAAAQQNVDKRNEAFQKGDILGGLGYDAKAGAANVISGVKSNIAAIFDPEERTRQVLAQKEPFLKDMLKDKGRQLTQGQYTDLEALGYIKNGQLTQKARDLNITVTVKDPAGHVLTTAVAAEGAPNTPNPIKGGAR